jgi:hypothetical protein
MPGLAIDIIDAAWVMVSKISYPYREVMNEIYTLKQKWKKTDRLRSNNYKIIANGFYGKISQCLEQSDGTYRAGIGWNPLYSSVITANTRIAVTRIQNLMGSDCFAVHTDSVMTRFPIPERFIGVGLGKFELVEKGNGVLVACGIYEINGISALKGFKKYTVSKLLEENPGKKKIKLIIKNHVESWLMAMAQNHNVSDINVFSNIPKILSLNCDTKRAWDCDVTSTDLLTTMQYSNPLIERQDEFPTWWK